MRRPTYPCKFGAHINTAVSEYEHFVGHLLDVVPQGSPEAHEWVEYEIPISLMVNNFVKSSLIHCYADDLFEMKGVTIHVEKQYKDFNPREDLDENGDPIPINLQVKRIDAIYNPEYE